MLELNTRASARMLIEGGCIHIFRSARIVSFEIYNLLEMMLKKSTISLCEHGGQSVS